MTMDLNYVMGPDWRPVERATLLFVIRDGRILLIHKKRGLGAGKINGPGGRLDPGETPAQAAVREVHEELCVIPRGVAEAGLLRFQFLDGLSLEVTVFTATDCDGTPCETEEAVPVWAPLDGIPYDAMWPDDILWMPLMLDGRPFQGYFLFDRDCMLAHCLVPTKVDEGVKKGT